MKEVASRVLVALEAIFISLPITLLFTGFVSSQMSSRNFSVAIATIGVSAALFSGWWLTAIFVFRGTDALRSTSVWWWIPPFLAVALGIFSALTKLLANGTESSSLGLFFFGIPLFLPVLHLLIERQVRGKYSF